jgi:GntR family transcriptional regulator
MQQLKIDKTPLYLQAHRHLLNLVEDGTLRPGEQLPAEADLAAQLGISRPTLREALLHLEGEGIIVRKHGVGTFVSRHTPILESGLEVLESLGRQAHRLGLNTEVVHLTVSERTATEEERKALQLSADDRGGVLDVDRVIAIEGAPFAYLKDVVPQVYLRREDLENQFSGSVLDILLRQENVLPVISRTQISAEDADRQLADRLGVPKGTALLKLVGQLYSYDEKVIDYSLSYFIPGHFKFHVTRRVKKGLP